MRSKQVIPRTWYGLFIVCLCIILIVLVIYSFSWGRFSKLSVANIPRILINQIYPVFEEQWTTVDNSVVLNAITKARKARQAYQAKMTAQAKKNAVSISANGKKLKACGVSKLKYSSKQKDVKCVRYLQKALTGLKLYTRQIDGWYGKYTKKAVKDFQKKYKKSYNLKVNGVMDTKTLNAIIKKDVKK